MGARAQVSLDNGIDPKVYLYTHWGSEELIEDLKTALKKRWRWDDYEYLARIIFDQIIGKYQGTETGFGIGTSEHGDNDFLVEILPDQKIRHEDKVTSFEEFIT